jgi:NhaP-type Na+/H+ and K+/H+ antiporter
MVTVKGSKDISKIVKGDVMKVDSLTLEVDSQYVMIDHGETKEMTIELFDKKTDKDYQIRYFNDNVENSVEFYELKEIMYSKMPEVKKIEW